jgi:hypothetical protein
MRRQPTHNAGFVLLMSVLLTGGAAAMVSKLINTAGGW